jgi:hypothetical protein
MKVTHNVVNSGIRKALTLGVLMVTPLVTPVASAYFCVPGGGIGFFCLSGYYSQGYWCQSHTPEGASPCKDPGDGNCDLGDPVNGVLPYFMCD